MIARTYIGGKDLYMGIPNLKDARISNVQYIEDDYDYCTELTIELVNGNTMKLQIKQEK